MNQTNPKNLAFIDGQNLQMGTAKRAKKPWRIDLSQFRLYLKVKYYVETAYYFLGCFMEEHQDIYEEIQKAGFILKFREHNTAMLGKKKGNVDSDIIFFVMRSLYRQEPFDRILLVSGDGDYKMLVDFLIEEGRFERMLFPYKRFASSLYRALGSEHYDHLDAPGVREKIEIKMKRAP